MPVIVNVPALFILFLYRRQLTSVFNFRAAELFFVPVYAKVRYTPSVYLSLAHSYSSDVGIKQVPLKGYLTLAYHGT